MLLTRVLQDYPDNNKALELKARIDLIEKGK